MSCRHHLLSCMCRLSPPKSCYANIPHLFPFPAMAVIFHSSARWSHLAISSCLDDRAHEQNPCDWLWPSGKEIHHPTCIYLYVYSFLYTSDILAASDQCSIIVHVDRSGNRAPGVIKMTKLSHHTILTISVSLASEANDVFSCFPDLKKNIKFNISVQGGSRFGY